MKKVKEDVLVGTSNGANEIVEQHKPYIAEIEIEGTERLLFNQANAEEMLLKAKLKRGDDGKKKNIPENRVYRDKDGYLSVPYSWIYGALQNAGASFQDPRSSRGKQAKELFKQCIRTTQSYFPIYNGDFRKEWDFIDTKCENVNKAKIVRERPAMERGWKCKLEIMVAMPEYISPDQLHKIFDYIGKFCGFGDKHPYYGQFKIVGFEIKEQITL